MSDMSQDAGQREPAQPINWKALLAGLAISAMIFGFGFMVWYYGIHAPDRAVRQSRDWVETPCEIVSSQLAIHNAQDGHHRSKGRPVPTYSIEVRYRYRYEGQEFISDRYDFSELSDAYLESKKQVIDSLPPGTETVCYVNPDDPADAVLRRDYGPETPDWKHTLFLWVSSIGMMLFGFLIGAGTLLVCFMDRISNAFDRHLDHLVDRQDPEGSTENRVAATAAEPLAEEETETGARGVISAGRARELLSVHGDVRSQDDSEWEGAIALPAAIAEFYREVGPVDIHLPSFGSDIYLPRLSELWNFQKKYAGSLADESLWHRSIGKWFSQWQRDWIAVAGENGSIYVYAGDSKHVLNVYGMNGSGEWRQSEIYPDLNTMAGCLAILSSVYLAAGGDDFEDFIDDRGRIHPPSMLEAKSRLTAELGSESQVEEILGASGWA